MGPCPIGMSTAPAAPILRLIRIGLDLDPENDSPEYEETIGLFIGERGGLTATERIRNWKAHYLAKYPRYQGYGGPVYPKWRVVEDELL